MRLLTAIALVLALILSATPATSQSRANTQLAVELAEQARTAFAEEKFRDAAELLQRAFAIYPEPNFVWNMARAWEKAGEDKLAQYNYLRFAKLDIDEAERQAALERAARLTALETLPINLRKAQDGAALAASQSANARLADALASRPADSGGSDLSLMAMGGWTSAALGVVALGTVFTLHLASIDTVEEYNDAANGNDRGRYDALGDTLQTRVVTSQVLLGTGLALTALGGTLLYFEYFDSDESPAETGGLRIGPALGADTAGVLIEGGF